MASPPDGTMQAAMGLVKEAIRLDSQDKTQDAYTQYLESVAFISQGLLTEAKEHTGPANVLNTKRLLQLAQQCIERASIVADRIQDSQALQQVTGAGHSEGAPGLQTPGSHSLPAASVVRPPAAATRHSLPPASVVRTPAAPGSHSLPPVSNGGGIPAAAASHTQPPASGGVKTVSLQDNSRSTLPTSPASARRMPPTPLEKAYQDNQKLLAAYQTRMARLQGRRDKGQLNLSLQRRMIENMTIAKAKQEALKRRMEERHRQYQEEAARQFTSADSLPLPEDQCQELYAQIKEFEDQELWLKAWRAKLTEHSNDLKLIEELVKQVLGCQDHPITKKMQQLQLKLYDRLKPLVEKLQQEPERITLPYIEDLSDLEHIRTRSSDQSSPGQDQQEFSVTEDKSASDESHIESQTNTADDRVVDYSSKSDQTSLDEQNALDQASESLEETNDEKAAENSGDFSDTVRSARADVKSAIDKGEELIHKLKTQSKASRRDSEAELAYLQNNMDDMFEDLTEECEDEDEPGNKNSGNQSQEEDGETGTENQEEEKEDEEKVVKMTEEAVETHLKQVVKDIREDMDHLLAMLIVGYRELNTVAGRDQCLATMEEPFFAPVWSNVGTLFRRANYKKEVLLARAMTRYGHALPEEVGVPERLCSATVEGTTLYRPAVQELRKVTSCNSPVSKLECIVRTCRVLCECVDSSAGKVQKTASTIGADDLLPLLSYVILQSELPQLVSECNSMEVFIREGYLLGEEGYCLTTLQTALDYVASLAK